MESLESSDTATLIKDEGNEDVEDADADNNSSEDHNQDQIIIK